MKWKPRERIKEGTKRIVKRFALIPITEFIPYEEHCARRGETRWMETVYIRQVRSGNYDGPDFWSNQEFVTKEEYMFYKETKKEKDDV